VTYPGQRAHDFDDTQTVSTRSGLCARLIWR
jgi:hypothetical protein